jgi:hypothetical protein
LDQPRWNTGDFGSSRKTSRNNRSGSHDAAIAQLNILQDHSLCPNPASIANLYVPSLHGQGFCGYPRFSTVITVCDINIRPEHILVPDLDAAASIDHEIAIEVISAAYADAKIIKALVEGPQPAPLGEGVVASNLYLPHSPTASAAFHAIVTALLHAKKAIHEQPHPA